MFIHKSNTVILPLIWLTIGIPTFRKPECLAKCLKGIFDNTPEEYRDKVEIIVVDNDENHSAKKICENFDMKCEYISGNFEIRTAESSMSIIESKFKGLYVWYLGDDDYIFSTLQPIFNIFKSRPDTILLSYTHLNLNLIYVINRFLPNLLFKLVIKFCLHYRLGFISMQIFSRKLDNLYPLNHRFKQMSFLNKSISIISSSKKISIIKSPIFFDSPTAATYNPVQYFNVFYAQVVNGLRCFPTAKFGYLIWAAFFFKIPGVSKIHFPSSELTSSSLKISYYFFIIKSLLFNYIKKVIK
ncbi:glycosyltransferase [Polynucleobacter sp. TSB-Sco08W16]|uniref:glycosyltransferase family 2 protein n=1 Tax=Polynucleobacter sp. TSB-Sco08W16 TaxID=1758374 RepID=UPI001BFE20D9|nr:glycosyltransferase [Polynucleobacter sp. TSB-Sco08W16]QWD74560.1 glycosyltransferase [Polynucleobacter sp. TSB-Sco08W16]